MDTTKKVLTPMEAARELRVCRKTIYVMLEKGQIPHIKCGDRWLIPVVAFEKWLQESYRSKAACA